MFHAPPCHHATLTLDNPTTAAAQLIVPFLPHLMGISFTRQMTASEPVSQGARGENTGKPIIKIVAHLIAERPVPTGWLQREGLALTFTCYRKGFVRELLLRTLMM